MPEMTFTVRWPDGSTMPCYSPSLVVAEMLDVGRTYPVAEFVAISRDALTIASQRVEAKYGFPCSNALAQLARIEATARRYDNGSTTSTAHRGAAGRDGVPQAVGERDGAHGVTVLAFDPPAAGSSSPQAGAARPARESA